MTSLSSFHLFNSPSSKPLSLRRCYVTSLVLQAVVYGVLQIAVFMAEIDGVSINPKKEVPQLIGVLKKLKEGLDIVTHKVQALTDKVKEQQFSTAESISYLEAKHLLLISYCQSLVYYLLRKAEGLSIQGHPVVRSLVEMRLFLEKIRPIDKKCGYLIERLLRTSATDAVKVDETIKGAEETQKTDDLLKYRPNPDNIVPKTDMGADGNGVGVYRPPKIAPTTMEEGKKKKHERDALRKLEDTARRVKRSEFVRDLIDDQEGRPEEIRERVGVESQDYARYAEKWEKREQQEEKRFDRDPITKRDKWELKQIKRSDGLLGMADFYDDIRALPFGDDADEPKTRNSGGSKSMDRKHNKRKRKY